MDPRHFDAFVRSLPPGTSRRGVLAGLVGGLLAALPAWPGAEGEAKKRKKRKKRKRRMRRRKRKRKNQPRPQPSCSGGTCADQFTTRADRDHCEFICRQCDGDDPRQFCIVEGDPFDPTQVAVCCADGAACCGDACCGGPGDPRRCCPGDGCVNTASDDGNCGACGMACTPCERCQGGVCVASVCQAPFTCCDGICVLADIDERHCGACGAACEECQECQDGACVDLCQAHQTCCPHIQGGGAGPFICVDTNNAPDYCGNCETRCGASQNCSQGECCFVPFGCSA